MVLRDDRVLKSTWRASTCCLNLKTMWAYLPNVKFVMTTGCVMLTNLIVNSMLRICSHALAYNVRSILQEKHVLLPHCWAAKSIQKAVAATRSSISKNFLHVRLFIRSFVSFVVIKRQLWSCSAAEDAFKPAFVLKIYHSWTVFGTQNETEIGRKKRSA